jgi:hypothetical protein
MHRSPAVWYARIEAAALACAVALTLLADHSHAQEPPESAAPVVVLLTTGQDDPVAMQARAELSSLGFRVVVVNAESERPSRAELEVAARKNSAVAAIRIVPQLTGAEVWVSDRVTGKTLLREVILAEGERERRAEVLAVRSVELLRASLLEVGSRLPERGQVAPPRSVEQLARRDRAAVTEPGAHEPPSGVMSVGPAMVWSPGGMPALFGIALAARARVAPRVEIGGGGFVPTLPGRVCEDEGCASVTLGIVGAELEIHLASDGAALRPKLGASVGLAWMRMAGDANAPFSERTEDLFGLATSAHAGLELSLGSNLALEAELGAGLVTPRYRMQFAGRDAASFGRPYLLGSLSLEVALP